MRTLNDERYRLFHRTLPEAIQGLENAATEYGYEFPLAGNRTKKGPMLTAFILSFMEMSEKEQRAFVKRGVEKLEYLLSLDDPNPPKKKPAKLDVVQKPGVKKSGGKKAD